MGLPPPPFYLLRAGTVGYPSLLRPLRGSGVVGQHFVPMLDQDCFIQCSRPLGQVGSMWGEGGGI
jgi:hypothetical protein